MVIKIENLKLICNKLFSKEIKRKIGFTLAETTTVLVILGVIASLTVPTLLWKQREIAERTKLKKAWEVYDAAILTMRTDHPMMTKESFTAWANQPNCPNTVSYFKTTNVDSNNGCVFKTPDGMWFNISDVMHPTVILDGNNRQTEDNTFRFVVSYDPVKLSFSVNNPLFPNLTSEEKSDLKKLFSKIDEEFDKDGSAENISECSGQGCCLGQHVGKECLEKTGIACTDRSGYTIAGGSHYFSSSKCDSQYRLYQSNGEYMQLQLYSDGGVLIESSGYNVNSSGQLCKGINSGFPNMNDARWDKDGNLIYFKSNGFGSCATRENCNLTPSPFESEACKYGQDCHYNSETKSWELFYNGSSLEKQEFYNRVVAKMIWENYQKAIGNQ